jgi:hypothetical protein
VPKPGERHRVLLVNRENFPHFDIVPLTRPTGSRRSMSPGKYNTTQKAKNGKTNGASWTLIAISSPESRFPTAAANRYLRRTATRRSERAFINIPFTTSNLHDGMALAAFLLRHFGHHRGYHAHIDLLRATLCIFGRITLCICWLFYCDILVVALVLCWYVRDCTLDNMRHTTCIYTIPDVFVPTGSVVWGSLQHIFVRPWE